MLVDESDSMAVTDARAETLATAIEAEGVPVSQSVVAADNDSRLGNAILANLEPNASLLVVSDGQVTGGRSLVEVGDIARETGATVHAVDLSVTRPERHVTLSGPAKTSVGIDNSLLVSVGGVDLGNESVTVTVTADGVPVVTEQISGAGRAEFTYAFDEVGTHRLVARIEGDDRFSANDISRKTVRVVPKPEVLYVSQGDYPFGRLLERLYEVTRAERIPEDLGPYQTVVLHDLPADRAGNVSALQRAVINGTGLVVAGGRSAYDQGGYAESPLAATLPVSIGEATGRTARIVLLVDVSGSSKEGMAVQKAISLDVLDQLGDENEVGIVGFNWRAYEVNPVVELGENRAELESRIRRLESGGATDIGVGLQGAAELLDGPGTIILVSDGRDAGSSAPAVAETLGQQGVQVVSVGVGENVDRELLTEIARPTGGQFLRAEDTDRLRLLFGGEARSFSADRLTVVDRNQFITAGVEPTANPELAHDVAVKPGADLLVVTGDGTPAFSQWRYGLGRVVSITTYGSDGTLDGLLEEPDSLLLSKSVNWAIADPERNARGVVSAPDTRVGESVTVRYVGPERPDGPPTFRQVAPDTYEATLRPTEPGFLEVLDASIAVNYPREQGAYGPAGDLRRAVQASGGEVFAQSAAAEIAAQVKQAERRTRDVREEWDWVFLTVALLVFLGEVSLRRLARYRGVHGRPAGTEAGGDD
jgi:orotate phosphoribosyltransferase